MSTPKRNTLMPEIVQASQQATMDTPSSATNGSRGMAVLDDYIRNRDTAFSAEERRHFGLEGLLPHAVESPERQTEGYSSIWCEDE